MRLDKYLKLTRIIKRREVANVLIKEGSILVNDNKVKPSYSVKIGDKIHLKLGNRKIDIEIIAIKDIVSKKDSTDLYNII